MTFGKILIAVDSEPVGAHAAEVGVELARAINAEVAFIYAIDTSTNTLGADTGVSPKQASDQAKLEGKRLLAGFRQRLALQPSALEFLEEGKPANEIVKAAVRWPADLIVIGSHGRRGVHRALVGSIAEGVMRNASCPVMVVRAKE